MKLFQGPFKKHFNFSPDDLKSIAVKIKQELDGEESGELIIASLDQMVDEEQFINNLKQLLAQRNIPEDKLKEAKIFSIMAKSNLPTTKTILIKNKFELKEETKIWETLIQNKIE